MGVSFFPPAPYLLKEKSRGQMPSIKAGITERVRPCQAGLLTWPEQEPSSGRASFDHPLTTRQAQAVCILALSIPPAPAFFLRDDMRVRATRQLSKFNLASAFPGGRQIWGQR